MIAATLLLLGFATTILAFEAAKGFLPKRPNFAGKQIPTAAGVCFSPVILATILLGAGSLIGVWWDGTLLAGYVLLAVLVGFYDDVRGGGEARGFKGHLGSLVGGRMTTGMVKIVALVLGALFVGRYFYGYTFEGLYAAFILAGCANLGNLFDVRPGRTMKFVGPPAAAMLFLAPGWAMLAMVGVFGGVLSLFYFDLKARMMLGDAGAAGVGALLGCLVAATGPGLAWWAAGAFVLVLTLVAEFSSISRFIEEVSVLRWLDNLGRGE
ncbi:MAG: hypothetical protein M3494_11465 [Actinomycetota bacterium]|jgi:hypothetical protein|nr:hypothetical protein [Rubrobacter sp.]MDQ3508613.1 hypothetical protein [Actinomycetota bacterium]